jgi:hypothetical protein
MEGNLRVEINRTNIIIGLNKFKLERKPCLLWASLDGTDDSKKIISVFLHEVNGRELSVTFEDQISAGVLQSLVSSKSYFCTQEKDFSFKIEFDRMGHNKMFFKMPSKALMPERRKGQRYLFHRQDVNIVYLSDGSNRVTSYRACDISKGGVGIIMSERESHDFIKRANIKISALPFVKKGAEIEFEIGRVESYRKKKFNSDELVKVVLKFKTQIESLNIPKKRLEHNSIEHLRKIKLSELINEVPANILSLLRFRYVQCKSSKEVAAETVLKNMTSLENFIGSIDKSLIDTLNLFGARKIAPSLSILEEDLLLNFLSFLSLENRKYCYEALKNDQSLIHTQRAQEELIKYLGLQSGDKIYKLKAA